MFVFADIFKEEANFLQNEDRYLAIKERMSNFLWVLGRVTQKKFLFVFIPLSPITLILLKISNQKPYLYNTIENASIFCIAAVFMLFGAFHKMLEMELTSVRVFHDSAMSCFLLCTIIKYFPVWERKWTGSYACTCLPGLLYHFISFPSQPLQ